MGPFSRGRGAERGRGPPALRVGRVRPSREGLRQEPAGRPWGGRASDLQGRGPLKNRPSVGSLEGHNDFS